MWYMSFPQGAYPLKVMSNKESNLPLRGLHLMWKQRFTSASTGSSGGGWRVLDPFGGMLEFHGN